MSDRYFPVILLLRTLKLMDVDISIRLVLEAIPRKQITNIADGRNRDSNLKENEEKVIWINLL